MVTMVSEIPSFCLRAYALFFTRYGTTTTFRQSALDWIVSKSMKKKIFATLLGAGWIQKASRRTYICTSPEKAVKGLLEFKVPEIVKEAKKPYAFTGLSAIEIWSDFSYVQRGKERSPYFVKIMRKDIQYWKDFFNAHHIPNYIGKGSTIGEFIILAPVKRIEATKKDDVFVESIKKTMEMAKKNEMFAYPYKYMKKKFGAKK
jgi:hypothetical protein